MHSTKDLYLEFPQINNKNQSIHFLQGQRFEQDLPQRGYLSGQ